MVSRVCIEKTQRVVSICGIDGLIDAREGKGILGASLVEVFEVDAQALGFVLLWYHYQVRQPIRMIDIYDESGLKYLG